MRLGQSADMASEVLRVHPEPFRYVDEATIHEILTAAPGRYVSFLEERLKRAASGAMALDLPPKSIFPDGPRLGDFRVMTCVTRDDQEVVKVVKVVGTNLAGTVVPDQVTVGKAFRLHPEDNYITHIFEACLLSSARTGACAAIAMRKLAPVRARVLVIGAGRVAFYAGLYASVLGGVEELLLYDVDPERAAAAACLLSNHVDRGIRCRKVERGEISATDVAIFATTSVVPLCAPQDLEATLVVSLGADTEEQRELDSSWSKVADVYVDSYDALRVGDLRAWVAEGAIAETDVVDLLNLLRRGPAPSSDRVPVFIATGSALFDNLTIAYLLQEQKRSPNSIHSQGLSHQETHGPLPQGTSH